MWICALCSFEQDQETTDLAGPRAAILLVAKSFHREFNRINNREDAADVNCPGCTHVLMQCRGYQSLNAVLQSGTHTY